MDISEDVPVPTEEHPARTRGDGPVQGQPEGNAGESTRSSSLQSRGSYRRRSRSGRRSRSRGRSRSRRYSRYDSRERESSRARRVRSSRSRSRTRAGRSAEGPRGNERVVPDKWDIRSEPNSEPSVGYMETRKSEKWTESTYEAFQNWKAAMHNYSAHPKDFINVQVSEKLQGQWPRLLAIKEVSISYEDLMNNREITREQWWRWMEIGAKAISGRSQAQDTVPRLYLEKIQNSESYMPALQEWSYEIGRFAAAYAKKHGSTTAGFLDVIIGEAERVWAPLAAFIYVEGIQNLKSEIQDLASVIQVAVAKYHYSMNHDPVKAESFCLRGSKLFPVFDKHSLGKLTETKSKLMDFQGLSDNKPKVKESQKVQTKESKPAVKANELDQAEGRCYLCHKKGHRKADCPTLKQASAEPSATEKK